MSSNDQSNSNDLSDSTRKLTNKKIEYLNEQIMDKNGLFDYLMDPNEYKRARK
jgi:hypothetical protein